MDYFFDEYPFSYNRNNYHSTPTPIQPPSRRYPSPPSWFEDNYRPTPTPTPSFHPFSHSPMPPAQSFSFQDNYPSTPAPAPAPAPRRKIRSARRESVSIPVNFIPNKPTPSDYALKIQKVFRGFRVRRNLKKILQLNSAVNDVANTFLDGDKVELMRCDERERLKLNEILMALLFKLDSVEALNDSIRLSRKAVIKKAILLQEKIDSLAPQHQTLGDETPEEIGEKGDETLEEIGGKGDETVEEIVDKSEGKGVETVEEKDPERRETGEKPWTMQVEDTLEEKLSDCCDNGDETAGDELDIDGVLAGVDQMQVDTTDGDADADAWECVGHNVEFVERDGDGDGDGESSPTPKRESNDEWCVIEEESNKLLQKMAEDNKRLLQMVADLCQKNATQTALITSLSDRVDKLEQAMNDDRLRRKKKKEKKKTTTTHYT